MRKCKMIAFVDHNDKELSPYGDYWNLKTLILIDRTGEPHFIKRIGLDPHPYKYEDIASLISTCLYMAKERNFKVMSWEAAGCIWYDVAIVDEEDHSKNYYPYMRK